MLQREHSEILSTFIKLPFVFKTFFMFIFLWPHKTGFTVASSSVWNGADIQSISGLNIQRQRINRFAYNLFSGKLSELIHKHEDQAHTDNSHRQNRGHRHISEHELKNKSDRHLNVQASICNVNHHQCIQSY